MIMVCGKVLAAVALLCTAAISLAADNDYPLTRIVDGIYVVYGPVEMPDKENRRFRNNPGIVLTSAGVVVIDPGGSAWAGEMVIERVYTLTSDPIVAVFNTHAHGDHWMGNEGIKRDYPDVVIYAHPIAKRKIEGAYGEQWLETIERMTEGTAGTKLVPPDKALEDGATVQVGDTQFRIHHAGIAHTDNDLMVEVLGQNVLFMGDLVRNAAHSTEYGRGTL